jgi:hypothetical protein
MTNCGSVQGSKPAENPNPVPASLMANLSKQLIQQGKKGYDGGKKIKGRRRHILVS